MGEQRPRAARIVPLLLLADEDLRAAAGKGYGWIFINDSATPAGFVSAKLTIDERRSDAAKGTGVATIETAYGASRKIALDCKEVD